MPALKAVSDAGCNSRKEADKVLEHYIPERPTRAFLLKNFVPTENGYRWRINLNAIDRCYADLVSWPEPSSTFDGPALVVAGGRSTYVVSEDEQLFRRYLSDLRLRFLPEAGHWVHTDSRDEFLRLIGPFLTGE